MSGVDNHKYLHGILDVIDKYNWAPWKHFDNIKDYDGAVYATARSLFLESGVIAKIRVPSEIQGIPYSEFVIRGPEWCHFQGYWRDHLVQETVKAAIEDVQERDAYGTLR